MHGSVSFVSGYEVLCPDLIVLCPDMFVLCPDILFCVRICSFLCPDNYVSGYACVWICLFCV